MTTSTFGMLFVASGIDVADEADFNKWYDHKHVNANAAYIASSLLKADSDCSARYQLNWKLASEDFR